MGHAYRVVRPIALIAVAVALAGLAACVAAEPTSEDNARLKQWLERFPAADADDDGVLTQSEAQAFRETRRGAQVDPQAAGPAPTLEDVAYGPHERNVLDFWKAEADEPTPVIVFIHGGGFVGGDKTKVRGDRIIRQALDAGVSFAAINYRYRTMVPIQEVLRDAGRAIQFLRFKAGEWNIDKQRVAAYGGSAGAGTSLWLASHDDLADPASDDPVLRESSRLTAAGSINGQFTYDVLQWEEVLEVSADRFHAEIQAFYGFDSMDQLETDEGKRIRADVDMRGLITPDDAPVYLHCGNRDVPPETRGEINHHPRHAIATKQRCDEVGVEAELYLPAEGSPPPGGHPAAMLAFFFRHLGIEVEGEEAQTDG